MKTANPDIKHADSVIREIVKKCDSLTVYQRRITDDNYCELVFYSKEIAAWEKILTNILGKAVKYPKAKPTKEDICLTKDYGGICDNQTLFRKDFQNTTLIAMFWPWQNLIHTTLKIAVISI